MQQLGAQAGSLWSRNAKYLTTSVGLVKLESCEANFQLPKPPRCPMTRPLHDFAVTPQFAINEEGVLGLILGSVDGNEYIGVPLFHNPQQGMWRSKNPIIAAISPSGQHDLRSMLREIRAFILFVGAMDVNDLVLRTCADLAKIAETAAKVGLNDPENPPTLRSRPLQPIKAAYVLNLRPKTIEEYNTILAEVEQYGTDYVARKYGATDMVESIEGMDEEEFAKFLDDEVLTEKKGGFTEVQLSEILQQLHNQNVDAVHASTDFSEIEKAVGNGVWYVKPEKAVSSEEFTNERLGEPYSEQSSEPYINEAHPSRYRRRCNRNGRNCGETITINHCEMLYAFVVSCEGYPNILIDDRENNKFYRVMQILGQGYDIIDEMKVWKNKPIGTFDRIAAAIGLR